MCSTVPFNWHCTQWYYIVTLSYAFHMLKKANEQTQNFPLKWFSGGHIHSMHLLKKLKKNKGNANTHSGMGLKMGNGIQFWLSCYTWFICINDWQNNLHSQKLGRRQLYNNYAKSNHCNNLSTFTNTSLFFSTVFGRNRLTAIVRRPSTAKRSNTKW